MKTALLSGLLLANLALGAHANWPAWRGGADGSGVTSEKNLPREWGTNKNVRWRIELPERGNSTPVVWRDRIFLTQPIEKKGERWLMCFNRADGKLLWQKGTTYESPEKTHRSNPYCSASPVTDGERVIVSFGTPGVFCYDFDGKELWRRDVGKLDHIWGNGPSPVLHGDLCFVYHGPTTKSVLYALDKKTGRTVWQFDEPKWDTANRTDGFKGEKDTIEGSFSTPIVIRSGGRDELVMSFPQEVRAFEPKTGNELWRCAGLSPLVYTSPLHADGELVAMGGFYGDSVAVRAGGNGDVTTSRRAWHLVRAKGGIGSGVIKDGLVFFPIPNGLIGCLDLKTGETVWEERPKISGARGDSWSSMLIAGDLVYLPNQAGDVIVFKAARKFEQVGLNSVNEPSNSSLAVSNGEILFRTHKSLWCFGNSTMTAAK
ncbi:MAG TPA: PQQ-binding-like beta-propeller repeat protein [Verrucomicrobiae bacterium]|jgi:outer membrane protein assembly factor BamB